MLQAAALFKTLLALVLCAILLALCAAPSGASGKVHHYIFFGLDRQKIREASFLNAKYLDGAQLKYTWRELEPKEGVYDFAPIASDLAFLRARGKTLFLQIQDSSFAPKAVNVPPYLTRAPQFHGGADRQYAISGDAEKNAHKAYSRSNLREHLARFLHDRI